MKTTFYIFAVLLFSLLGCGKESLEIPKPDLSVDWQKHVFEDVRPVDETGYPPCEPWPPVNNENHPTTYRIRYTLQDSFVSSVNFPTRDGVYAVYQRTIPEALTDPNDFFFKRKAILLDLRTGKTQTLGYSSTNVSIEDKYVVFGQGDKILVYHIPTKGRIYHTVHAEHVDVDPTGTYAIVKSERKAGRFQEGMNYIFRISDWRVLAEIPEDTMDIGLWIDSSLVAYDRFLSTSLFSYNIFTKEKSTFAGPFNNHFRSIIGISRNREYIYGRSAYVQNLSTGTKVDFHDTYNPENCATRDYGEISSLPNGKLLAWRRYYTIHHDERMVYPRFVMRLFDEDGTNERMVTLLLK